ncbi:MAG: ribosome hibernation-promoting factor, HPF/YfiA family [Oligoflexus sp.]
MSLQVSFRNMESSTALDHYARQKIRDVLEKFISADPTNIQLTFQVDNLDHVAHCDLHLGKVGNISIDASSESMYASVDKLVDKLQRQLRKEKNRLVEHQQFSSKFDRANLIEEHVNNMKEKRDIAEAIDAEDIVRIEQSRGGSVVGS